MAVAVRRETGMSVAEYRTWVADRPDDERWKLLDGEPELMSPPNARHQRIVMKLGRHLDRLAERRGRNALPGLGVLSAAMDDVGPIPDVVVICGPLPPDGYTHDPVLVAEVLSPSTMTDDLGRNTGFHRSVQSLRTFLIVYQDQPKGRTLESRRRLEHARPRSRRGDRAARTRRFAGRRRHLRARDVLTRRLRCCGAPAGCYHRRFHREGVPWPSRRDATPI